MHSLQIGRGFHTSGSLANGNEPGMMANGMGLQHDEEEKVEAGDEGDRKIGNILDDVATKLREIGHCEGAHIPTRCELNTHRKEEGERQEV
jgi:hypothetical protein